MNKWDLFYDVNKEQLTHAVFQAYYDARKNKRNTVHAIAFEKHFETYLFDLIEEVMNQQYKCSPSICFIVNKPVKREIFAAC